MGALGLGFQALVWVQGPCEGGALDPGLGVSALIPIPINPKP